MKRRKHRWVVQVVYVVSNRQAKRMQRLRVADLPKTQQVMLQVACWSCARPYDLAAGSTCERKPGAPPLPGTLGSQGKSGDTP